MWTKVQARRQHIEIVDKANLCRTNATKVMTAAMMYETDYAGKLPNSIQEVGPEYLWPIPICPFDSSPYQVYNEIMTEETAHLLPSGLVETGPGCIGIIVRCTSDLHAQLEPGLKPRYGYAGFKQREPTAAQSGDDQ